MIKLENNWKQKTLENLEKHEWLSFDSDSRLLKRIKVLRKLPLEDFTIEDLRLMIGQNESLNYLIPLALEKLEENILAEGDFYKGDLLLSVVNSRSEFWENSIDLKNKLVEMIMKNKQKIEDEDINITLD